MFNLFNKSKVRVGKQSKDEKKTVASSAAAKAASKSPLQSLSGAWAKLNKMDRKQAYTWGAVAVVGLIALLTLGSATSSDEGDFSSYQTRGYDLANMPFSTDEAEQYLLANKYPDMKNNKPAASLYSQEEKEARQEQDAEEAAEKALNSATSKASEYRPGRYYGNSGGGRTGAPTQVGKMNSASMGRASGSGLSGTFGATGDFSNFRSQEKGYDKFTPQGPGKGDARKALFQSAMASRAAAGLKNDKMANAKRALMGGDVRGDKAFMDDSGAVNLGELKGLELDENAPQTSTDLSGLNDAVEDAKNDAANDAADNEQKEWWEEMLIDMAKQFVQGLLNIGMNMAQNEIDMARKAHEAEEAGFSEWMKQNAPDLGAIGDKQKTITSDMLNDSVYGQGLMDRKGYTTSSDGLTLSDKKGNPIATRPDSNSSWTLSDPNNPPKFSGKDRKWANEQLLADWDQNHPELVSQRNNYVETCGKYAKSSHVSLPPISTSNGAGNGGSVDFSLTNGTRLSGTRDANGIITTKDGRRYRPTGNKDNHYELIQ